jgi:glycosyltransferase involved in cell wall biosynthesis
MAGGLGTTNTTNPAAVGGCSDLSILVPAWNEEDNLHNLLPDLTRLFPHAPKIVVDNNSIDETGAVAIEHGATLVSCITQGKGAACRAGLEVISTKYVFICDADISGMSGWPLECLAAEVDRTGVPFGRLAMNRPAENAPVTSLLVRPLLKALKLTADLLEPIGGLMYARVAWLRSISIPDNWALDIAITLHSVAAGHHIPEIEAPGMTHRHKPIGEYTGMAQDIADYILSDKWR